ncbi:hypothetical protein [Micromonospora sp. RTGN7]|uniref:hypothetical protein n=1 Tax=Micromonospora sp. RTGN7 TaxID=3016526 RepID=UPI0029FF0285|nr:hypothetical protein [Micromonospora sp. RTGN7]
MQGVVSPTSTGLAFLARPGRPAVVTATLTELSGPTRGLVELPVRLMWNTERTFDLGDPDDLLWMYENVLRETTRAADLRELVNGRLLRQVWCLLNLPRGVRDAWEHRHRVLRGDPASWRSRRSEPALPTA